MVSCNLCHPQVDSVLPEINYQEEYNKAVHQASLNDGSRDILYGTCGDPTGTPILFFPPLGSSRRMMWNFHHLLQKFSLYAISVNRPGAENTVAAKDAPAQVETFCSDTLKVMDSLGIDQAGIFCMCAGTTFALAFCAKYPERTSGKFLALGPWTLPADCPHHKRLERFAANYLTRFGISSIVGSVQFSMMNLFSNEFISKKLMDTASADERKYLEERYKDKPEGAFAREMDWVLGRVSNETMDVAVCLSKSSDLGFDYAEFEKQDVLIWQGDVDKIAHPPASKWLQEQLPNAAIHLIPGSTHNGALLMLGAEYENALAHLKLEEN